MKFLKKMFRLNKDHQEDIYHPERQKSLVNHMKTRFNSLELNMSLGSQYIAKMLSRRGGWCCRHTKKH